VIIIDVLGTPAPKGSARAFYKAGMKRAVIVKDNSERQKSWDRAVREAALEVIGERVEPVYVGCPVVVEIVFRLKRPASHWSKKGGLLPSAPLVPTTKPDGDKLLRTTWDALTGLAWDDDSRIADGIVRKRYAEPGREGARITIEELKA